MLKIFKAIVIFSSLITLNFAQAQNLIVTLGQSNQLLVKIGNQSSQKCSIVASFPNGANAQFDVSAPEYIANIIFTPTTEGINNITWEGKFKRRGLNSLAGCDGNGGFSVYVTPNNEVKAQRWIELASKISEKQKACITTGLKEINGNLDFKLISGDINVDAAEPAVKNIRTKCEGIADYVLKKNQTCTINNKLSSCDEIYESNINGEVKRFSEDELLNYIFKKEQIQKVNFENSQAKVARENADAEEARKLEAYRKTPAYKIEQAKLEKKRIQDEALAKKEQAQLEKKKMQEDALAMKAAEAANKQKIESLSCYVLESTENKKYWATGGQIITSCNPIVIQSQITEPYGTVMIWQFSSGNEISRATITSSKMTLMGSVSTFWKNSYKRNGKEIIENVDGCMQTSQIVSETPDSITMKTMGATGDCRPTVIGAIGMLINMPPSRYIKIKG